jgi:hypothetical protein
MTIIINHKQYLSPVQRLQPTLASKSTKSKKMSTFKAAMACDNIHKWCTSSYVVTPFFNSPKISLITGQILKRYNDHNFPNFGQISTIPGGKWMGFLRSNTSIFEKFEEMTIWVRNRPHAKSHQNSMKPCSSNVPQTHFLHGKRQWQYLSPCKKWVWGTLDSHYFIE